MDNQRNERYIRNGKTIDPRGQQRLSEVKVCVLGCGGLGGYLIEMLARAGVMKLKVVDGDFFEISNLNRQLLSKMDNLKASKSLAAKNRIYEINPDIEVEDLETFIDEKNVDEIISGCQVVIDGLDSLKTRKMVIESCKRQGIPFIFGAIAGWYGQVATITPSSTLPEILFEIEKSRGAEVGLGNPSFTPAVIAGYQVSECIKLLLGKGKIMDRGFLNIDLLHNEVEEIIVDSK